MMSTAIEAGARAIVYRTRGSRHGGITRLMSPGDLGEFLKPFVFLDLFGLDVTGGHKGFGLHPHSGIATLTWLMEGDTQYEDTTGEQGTLRGGGVEWMRAGNGVWHTGAPAPGVERVSGFQLWVALPPSEENGPAQSMYLAPSQVPAQGPARVLLGRYGAAQSPIAAPSPMNYLAVKLKDGERWTYLPPAGHTVGWIAVSAGALEAGRDTVSGELAVFAPGEQAIDIEAGPEGAGFVLGSAVPHPHPLVMGYYSVHTSKAALEQGEAEIRRIGARLRQEGRIA